MTTKQKPEQFFATALAAAYPGMSGEQRRGIVGMAVRAFITPGEIARTSFDPDQAAAIGEHAFRAGYSACEGASHWGAVDSAWDNYDPPENLKR